jgi:SAM-dependent methyltransferase
MALRARDSLASLPVLSLRELVYNNKYFEIMDAENAEGYRALGAAIVKHAAPRSIIDVGCGSGLLLGVLAGYGVHVAGVEGSKAAIARSPLKDAITRANLERGVPALGRYDLCICMEVAEHIRPAHASALVEGLTRLSDRVIFSGATPDQGGTLHINEQPREYWGELFSRQGFAPSPLADLICSEIAHIAEPAWLRQNLVSFAPCQPDAHAMVG